MKTKPQRGSIRTNVSLSPVVYQCSRELQRELVASSFSNLVARLVSEKCLALGINANGKAARK